MKDKTRKIIGLSIIVISVLILISAFVKININTEKTSIQEFENKCKNSGGNFFQTENKDYNICECYVGDGNNFGTYTIYYKDVKRTIWNGCFRYG